MDFHAWRHFYTSKCKHNLYHSQSCGIFQLAMFAFTHFTYIFICFWANFNFVSKNIQIIFWKRRLEWKNHSQFSSQTHTHTKTNERKLFNFKFQFLASYFFLFDFSFFYFSSVYFKRLVNRYLLGSFPSYSCCIIQKASNEAFFGKIYAWNFLKHANVYMNCNLWKKISSIFINRGCFLERCGKGLTFLCFLKYASTKDL